MAKGPSYCVPFRRRREGKTDYKARRALITSGLPRVVTRCSLKHMTVQIIEAQPKGDRIIASANSQELRNFGWQTTCGNIPSAYLTGLLCGKRATERQVKRAVPDIGLHPPTRGSRVFSALKGVIDAGVVIPHSEDKLPNEKRVKGQHIADYAKTLATSNSEFYERGYASYLKNKVAPEKLPEYFLTAKEKIVNPQKKGDKKEKTMKKKGKRKGEK
ncbi:MAG: 50S ribosomal protein L18 [Candidatus Bathyarchaeota archaeon]|nr:MAG: 50S ribosomal protein L18 [Candidatus Bathyarchaeota archaeon]